MGPCTHFLASHLYTPPTCSLYSLWTFPLPHSPCFSLSQGPNCALILREVITVNICSTDTEWVPLCWEQSTGALERNKTCLIPSYVVSSKAPLTSPWCTEGRGAAGIQWRVGMNRRIRGARVGEHGLCVDSHLWGLLNRG